MLDTIVTVTEFADLFPEGADIFLGKLDGAWSVRVEHEGRVIEGEGKELLEAITDALRNNGTPRTVLVNRARFRTELNRN